MSAKRNIYFISGMAADRRIFKNLDLPSDYSVHHLPWITPEKNETIEQYSARMAAGIADSDPVLIGVSFGGMVSVEISKLMPVRKVIIISSIKSRREKPFTFRMAAALRLNRIVPIRPYRILEPIQNYNLGVETAEEKRLAGLYRRNLDLKYTRWAIDRVLHWRNESYPDDIVHIHGSEDRIFPVRYTRPTHVVKGGHHLMIMSRAEEISAILQREIAGL